MRKNVLIYHTGILLIFFSAVACGSVKRYHCKHPGSHMAWDKMVEVYRLDSGQRAVFTDYFSSKTDLGKTHNEGNVIVTVYEELNARKYRPSVYNAYQSYRLLKIDMSSSPVKFYFGYAYHDTIEGFEKSYQMPYTEKNFNSINTHPEIVKYIPSKEHEQHMSFGFWNIHEYDCGEPLNYFEYIIKKSMVIFSAILSAV